MLTLYDLTSNRSFIIGIVRPYIYLPANMNNEQMSGVVNFSVRGNMPTKTIINVIK